jgi:hypothetical protein
MVLRSCKSERSQMSALQMVSATLLLPVPTNTAPRDSAASENRSVPTSESATMADRISDTSSLAVPQYDRPRPIAAAMRLSGGVSELVKSRWSRRMARAGSVSLRQLQQMMPVASRQPALISVSEA